MGTEIKCICKNGKIIPLDDVGLEENAKVIINVLSSEKTKKHLLSLAGVWKDDDKTYNTFKGVLKNRNKFKLRKWLMKS